VRRVSRAAGVLATAAVTLLVGCVPTARTAGPYSAKAVRTAEAVHSALASDLLVVRSLRRHHTTAAYVSVATSAAEDDGSAAASTFLAIQPPDDQSEQLRDELSDLLDAAESALGDTRIAGRRGDRGAVLASADALTKAAADLDHFAQAHS
jgi:hypothetical protein